MSGPTELERDILNNARDRLHLWAKDTAMRCDAADLDARSLRIILGVALTEILMVLTPKDGTRFETFMLAARHMVNDLQQKESEDAKHSRS